MNTLNIMSNFQTDVLGPDDSLELIRAVYDRLFHLALSDCQLVLECPVIELKVCLGKQLHDLVRLASACRDRIVELASEPPQVDDTAFDPWTGTQGEAFAERERQLVKLSRDCTAALERIHPNWDEPTARLLRNIVTDLGPMIDDMQSQQALLDPGLMKESLKTRNPASTWTPARDNRFCEGQKPRPSTNDDHGELVAKISHVTLMGTEIPTIEVCADLILEFHVVGWDFVQDMARQSWDEARHATSFIQKLAEVDGSLGAYPTDFVLWQMSRVDELPLRLCIHQRIGEWIGIDAAIGLAQELVVKGDLDTARLLEFVGRDEITHVAFGNKWIKRLLADEAAVLELQRRAEEIRTDHGQILTAKGFPLMVDVCRKAGLSEAEISYLAGQHGFKGKSVAG